MAVTMRDVARRAGVSKRTVSRVINKQGEISEATRLRVSQIIETLGYQPNGVARSLRSKKTCTIGMIIPDSSSLFFAEVARSIEDTCFRKGYSVILGRLA